MRNQTRYLVGVVAILATLALALVFAGGGDARPGFYKPRCAIKNPAFVPVLTGDVIMGQINNRCEAPVLELGAYGCLQRSLVMMNGLPAGWVNVWCEANRLLGRAALTLYVDTRCKFTTTRYAWRIQGYAWVNYGPYAPDPFYRSQTVTSAYFTTRCR